MVAAYMMGSPDDIMIITMIMSKAMGTGKKSPKIANMNRTTNAHFPPELDTKTYYSIPRKYIDNH